MNLEELKNKKRERIWLQIRGVDNTSDEVTWCEDKIHEDDVEYIRADVVVSKLSQHDTELVDSPKFRMGLLGLMTGFAYDMHKWSLDPVGERPNISDRIDAFISLITENK